MQVNVATKRMGDHIALKPKNPFEEAEKRQEEKRNMESKDKEKGKGK